MESYPIGKISFATKVISASSANTSSFATLKVLTASIALDAPGPSGSSGSSFPVSGTPGPQGPAGPQGPKGLGVYLLADTLATCCNTFQAQGSLLQWRATTNSDSSTYKYCNEAVYSIGINENIYSSGSTPFIQAGYTINYSRGCDFPISSYPAVTDGGVNYYLLDGSGGVTAVLPCDSAI
jgi:hypothetical protein